MTPTELNRFQKYGLADVHKFKSSGAKRNYDEILKVVEHAKDCEEKYSAIKIGSA
ncbi:hypothetical protein [Staphylococcus epidermidis]|uniref:hypothetical protein n=1 Tax=Staphylococcus epidermidis TaxID=1282 RepID=UPI0019334660|nr:hypothetical protein [Staphylococcus epidermidis]MCO6203513.1 hypothetical protein [Staphylococcus epidermidis]MCO6286881.1 hypothetical protein [Staphylococcus epidermidis]MCO6323311.1 hypothetical protein [Staphylococcus epidermidis]